MTKMFYIVWPDFDARVVLNANPAAEYYYSCAKHLQHLTLDFNERSNGLLELDFDNLSNKIKSLGSQLHINVQVNQLKDQAYLNLLHTKYFDNVRQLKDFDRRWLMFHDYIHLLEDVNNKESRSGSVWFDFLEKAGPLIKPFDRSWLNKFGTNDVERGMCIMQERELGKNPWKYMKDKESDDLLETSKPWMHLRPAFNIITKTQNRSKFVDVSDREQFLEWFKPNQKKWCEHWNINDWNPEEMFMAIPIGTIEQIDEVEYRFKTQKYPIKISL